MLQTEARHGEVAVQLDWNATNREQTAAFFQY